MNPKSHSRFVPIRFGQDFDEAHISKSYECPNSKSFELIFPDTVANCFPPRKTSHVYKDSRRFSNILELRSELNSDNEFPRLFNADLISPPLSSNTSPTLLKYDYTTKLGCLNNEIPSFEKNEDSLDCQHKFKSLRRLPILNKNIKSSFKIRKTNSPQKKALRIPSHSPNWKSIDYKNNISDSKLSNFCELSPIVSQSYFNISSSVENSSHTLSIPSSKRCTRENTFDFVFENNDLFSNHKESVKTNFPSLSASNIFFPTIDHDNDRESDYNLFARNECNLAMNNDIKLSCSKKIHNNFPSLSEFGKIPNLRDESSSKGRKYLSSLRSRKRTSIPLQSSNSINNSPQSSSYRMYSPFIKDSTKDIHTARNSLTRLRTSRSADNNLHSYSDFNQLGKEVSSSDPFSSDQLISTHKTLSIKSQTILSNKRVPILNIQQFVPIMRSESTPCLFSPNSRIGVKRKAEDTHRPTANFAKMWDSQITPCISTPDTSPINYITDFSGYSPNSLSDDPEGQTFVDRLEFGKNQELRCPELNNLDIQLIEEN